MFTRLPPNSKIIFLHCSLRNHSINLLKPNDIYIRVYIYIYIYIYVCRTAALTFRRYILNIYSTNTNTEYFKHAA